MLPVTSKIQLPVTISALNVIVIVIHVLGEILLTIVILVWETNF